jgi:hypothetical protein
MTHEPECPDAECKAANGRCAYCQCDRIRAAYHRGYEKGFGDGHEQGKTWMQIQGDAVIRQAEAITCFNQHGRGENP